MRKLSYLHYTQDIALADHFEQESEVVNSWSVRMNNLASNAERQDNARHIVDTKPFLELLLKVFTLSYMDISYRSNKARRDMMAYIESTSYIKNDDGSEILKFVMNYP